ncbi:MAG: hypothetical protein ABSG52_16385 [Terriglobales bacterium]|jgi:hypothetical protein
MSAVEFYPTLLQVAKKKNTLSTAYVKETASAEPPTDDAPPKLTSLCLAAKMRHHNGPLWNFRARGRHATAYPERICAALLNRA